MELSVCNDPSVLTILMLVKTFINVIKIAAPLTLIITASITFMKAVCGSEDDIDKSKKIFVNKLIAAAVIFLVPTILTFAINLTGTDTSGIRGCMLSATPEGIGLAHIAQAEKSLSNAKKSLSKKDYFNAQTAIYNISDESKKNDMLAELTEIKSYVDLMESIQVLENSYTYEKYKNLKEELGKIEDDEVKEKLSTKFDEISQTLFAFIGSYPVVPFGEHELYTGLKTYKGDSLDNLLRKNGSSAEELNEKIKTIVEYYGVGTRKAVVGAVVTLIGSVAETGYQLPYFWGGTWQHLGVNPDWGTPKYASACKVTEETEQGIAECVERYKYWALDCAGFVNWAIIQGIQEEKSMEETNNGTSSTPLNSKTADHAICNIGDTIGSPGHIALVIGLDDENKRYIIAEESSGLEIDSVPYGGSNGHYCVLIDEYID